MQSSSFEYSYTSGYFSVWVHIATIGTYFRQHSLNFASVSAGVFYCMCLEYTLLLGRCGQVVEWLYSGLQNRRHRFDSGPSLHYIVKTTLLCQGGEISTMCGMHKCRERQDVDSGSKVQCEALAEL